MIPKIIHYCWFSGEPFPTSIEKCMKSWKIYLSDYEWRCWDAHSFDFDSIPYVREAITVRNGLLFLIM